MTERKKMLAGKIYKPFGDGLAGERTLAHNPTVTKAVMK